MIASEYQTMSAFLQLVGVLKEPVEEDKIYVVAMCSHCKNAIEVYQRMIVQKKQTLRIAFLLDSLSGGGAEQVILNLASGFASAGFTVDLLVCKMKGQLLGQIPSNVTLIRLNSVSSLSGMLCALRADIGCFKLVMATLIRLKKVPGNFKSLPAIIDYLKKNQPAALLSALPKSNISAVLAGSYCRGSTRIAVGMHSHYSAGSQFDKKENSIKDAYMLAMMRRYYGRADVVIAVSNGTKNDACEVLELPQDQVAAVYNPVATHDIAELREEAPDHPWLAVGDIPVIIGIGRFVAEKDFPLLLDAFAKVRQERQVRLIFLGGDFTAHDQRSLKTQLLEQAEQLGVAGDIDMPGFVDNPFAYLSKAGVFVLSSACEGFGNVLVEALLCGCPVVSTDCPGGPAEILENGKYGELVPVGDKRGLADAICRALDAPLNREFLRTRGSEFSVEVSVDKYRRLLFESGSLHP